MTSTQGFLDRFFADVWVAEGEDTRGEAGIQVEGGHDSRRVLLSKIAAAVRAAMAALDDRVMECHTRRRADVIKHHIQMFDLRFLQVRGGGART